ncbi:MAG: hypothetical protein L3J28_15125 [Candidatus Polarisedimenticolaceae bacterium]|nr:hypothetical protein [Candidatus Polarisedimenticolaceae bacterium]
MKAPLILLCTLLLSGCALWPIQQEIVQPSSEADLIQQADRLRKQKLYAQAEQLLFQARTNNPDSIKLQKSLQRMMAERQRYRQQIEDQLLIARVIFIQQQRPLMVQLAKSESDDRMISTRLNHMNSEWLESRQRLSSCGERRRKSDPNTAEKCLQLALAIDPQKSDRKYLAQIEAERADAANLHLEEEGARKIRELLEQAKKRQQSGEFYHALSLLKQILELSPGQPNAILLEEQIKKEFTELATERLTTGEDLYQKGRIKEAIAIWKRLLKLDPKHKPAQEKIERAQRVLDNLQQLRKEQKPSVTSQTN